MLNTFIIFKIYFFNLIISVIFVRLTRVNLAMLVTVTKSLMANSYIIQCT